MTDRSFLDTNILVYAYDVREPIKQARAQEVLKQGIENETAILSVQVIGEFFTVVTKRILKPLSAEEAEQALDLLSILPIIDLDSRMVRHAIAIHRQHGIAYWDALIVAAAHRAECTQILTEDLNAGQSYSGVTVVNPF
ncbi:MAG: PIN domain-containing protein [Chloroflexi bacterium]|nr:PIN domain-containing protein [Chloroflexota bacterium]